MHLNVSTIFFAYFMTHSASRPFLRYTGIFLECILDSSGIMEEVGCLMEQEDLFARQAAAKREVLLLFDMISNHCRCTRDWIT